MAEPVRTSLFDSADPTDLSRTHRRRSRGRGASPPDLARTCSGTDVVRVVEPHTREDGWESPHTVVEIVTDDLPFLVDSVTRCSRARLRHPPAAAPGVDGACSCTSRSTVRPTERSRRARGGFESVLADVRVVVDDWQPMRDRALELAAALRAAPPPTVDPADVAEAATFLEWLADDHFTFIGECDGAGGDSARRRCGGVVPSGLPGHDVGPRRRSRSRRRRRGRRCTARCRSTTWA